MKKNIILESYSRLFFESFDHTRIPKEYLQNLVDDLINDSYEGGYIEVAGYKLTPSECLKKCDPLAYNEYFTNYCNSQQIQMNDDGTYYDHMDQQLGQTHQQPEELMKQCCHCCGNEFLRQELDPSTGYCMSCQQDELLHGPKEFRVSPDDTQQTIIIKESCMKRWKASHKKGNK